MCCIFRVAGIQVQAIASLRFDFPANTTNEPGDPEKLLDSPVQVVGVQNGQLYQVNILRRDLFEEGVPLLIVMQYQPLEESAPIPVLAVPDATAAGFTFGVDEYIGSCIGHETERGAVASRGFGGQREAACQGIGVIGCGETGLVPVSQSVGNPAPGLIRVAGNAIGIGIQNRTTSEQAHCVPGIA